MSSQPHLKDWKNFLQRFKADRARCKEATIKAIQTCREELPRALSDFSIDNIGPVSDVITSAYSDLQNAVYRKPITLWETDFDIDLSLSKVVPTVLRPRFSGDERAACFDAGAISITCCEEQVFIGNYEVEFRYPQNDMKWSMKPSAYVNVRRYGNAGPLAQHRRTHPHVNDSGLLCCGNAHPALNEALHCGDIVGAIEIVKSILSGYNPGGAYWRVEDLLFPQCSDCGARASEARMHTISGAKFCPRCVETFEGKVYRKGELVTCACCSVKLPKDRMRTHGRRHVCSKCYDTVATSRECANCGKLHDKSVSHEWQGCDICPECWTIPCPTCATPVTMDNLVSADNAWKCPHCRSLSAADADKLRETNDAAAEAARAATAATVSAAAAAVTASAASSAASDAAAPQASGTAGGTISDAGYGAGDDGEDDGEDADDGSGSAPGEVLPPDATATSDAVQYTRCGCGARVNRDIIRVCTRTGRNICDICDPDETNLHSSVR